jgi:hypothetical protein
MFHSEGGGAGGGSNVVTVGLRNVVTVVLVGLLSCGWKQCPPELLLLDICESCVELMSWLAGVHMIH